MVRTSWKLRLAPIVLLCLLLTGSAWGQVSWSNTGASTAWATGANWSTSAYPTSAQYAQFNNAGTATTAGLNISNLGGGATYTIQAIEVTSSRTRALSIGSSQNAFTLSLTGQTISSTNNVILRNASGSTFTLAPLQGGTGNMAVGLGNATENKILIDGAGDIAISSVITGASRSLTLAGSGSGRLLLSGVNTYSGGTTISAGTLRLAAAGVLADAGAITLDGGTFSTGATTGFSETVGTLTLTNNSTLALGTGNHTLNFANSSGTTWTSGKMLTITGWVGGYNGTAATGTNPKIFVGSAATHLTSGQLAQIQFFNGTSNFPATLLSTGELVAGVAGTAPTVSTDAIGTITYNSAVLNGSVSAAGTPTSATNKKGFVYSLTSTNATPTIGGTGVVEVINTTGTLATGSFTNTPNTLASSSGYSWRAYAINDFGTTYGSVSTFTTSASPTASLSISGTAAHGSSCVGAAAGPITYTITNTGGADATGISVASDNAEFAITTALSSTTVLQSGGTVTFGVTFTPSASGSRTANLTVTGGGGATYAISGTGTALTAPPAPTANTATAGGTAGATLGGTTTAATCPTTLTEQGVVLSSSVTTPTIADTKFAFSNNTPGVKTVAVSGLNPGTRYYYRAYATNSQSTTYNATVSSFNTRKLEPTNHVSSFTKSAQTGTSMTFTWTDNAGAAAADSFLVRLSTGTPTDPTDGTPVTANPASDVYVAAGVQTVTFTGLTTSTTYNAKIYPLVNTGVGGIDYKTVATVPSASGTTNAGPLAAWNLTSTTTSATTTGGGITSASAISLSSGTVSYQASPSNINTGSWSTSATFSTSGKYWQFSITPTGAMTISGVSFDAGRTTAGPASMQVQYSLDAFATAGVDALVGANNANTSSLTTFNLTSLPPTTAGTVTFRIWGYNASGTGNFRLNNVVINGTVANAPSLSVSQTVTQASGSNFAYGSVEAGSFSDKVFTLTNNGSATLNISSISTTGTGYSIQAGGSTTSIPASGTATVTVRYTPSSFTLQAGTLDIQSDDITNPTYTVNLTGVATPSVQSDIANLTTPNGTVDYTLYQSSTISNATSGANGSYGLMRFDIRDGGGAADNDALPTILQDITFTVNNGAAIRQAALFSTSNSKLNTADPVINAGTGTISFSSLPAGSFTVADGGSLSVWLRVSFTTTVTDNQAITASVSNTNTIAAGSNTSSGFKTFSLTSSSSANKTLVIGTGIGFAAQPPASVGVASNFGLSVQVQDANGNRDLDANTGTITLTKLTGGGTLSGTTTGSIVSGVFSPANLQIDQLTTGVTLQASLSPTLSGPNVIVTNSFNVNGVGYTVGCYRTKSSGTTNWGTASNWEYLDTDGVTWLAASAAPDDPTLIAHVERSMTMGNYGGSYSRWTLNTLYVKNSGTVLTTNSGTSPGLDIVGTNGELRILNGAKVAATAGINFRDVVFSISASTAKLTVDSLSTLSINYTCNNQSLIWNGVENFKNGSILEILFWDVSTSALVDPTASRTVTPNAAGYCFGKININSSNGNTMKLVSSTTPVKLCQNDLTIISNNSFNVIGSTDAATVTYGGVNVQGDQLSFYGVTSASTLTSTVEGNLSVSGSATIDLNQNNAAGGTNTIILKGNYSNTSTGDIKCTDAAGTGIIQFDGAKAHTVTQTSTFSSPCVNIAWQVTGADTVVTASNWALSNNSNITVQSAGYFQFGSNGSGPYRVVESNTSDVTAFTLAAGGTLVINDQSGITSSGATGNVQTDTRSFNNASNYYYKTYASFTQATGSAFDALAGSPFTGVITWEGFSNAQSLTFASSFTINTPGKLVVKKGYIAESATIGQPTIDGSGSLEMSGGQLIYNRVGSSLTFPRLTGTYTITGGGIFLNGTTNSASNIQQLRGGRTYYDVTLGGASSTGGYKTVTSAVVINGTLTIPTGEIFDPASSGVSGPGGLTMTGGVFRISKLSNNQPELGGTYTLSGGTVELYGTSASQQQNLRSKDDANNTITYASVLVNAAATNPAGNVDLTGFTAVSTEFRVNSPAYLNMDAAEGLTGAGNFILSNGTGLRFANAYGIRTSGTGTTDGSIRVSGTRTLPTQATYIAAGSAASASLGNAIPDGADSVIIARTSGDISTAGALKVGQKLRFASASKILTGTDTVSIGATGFVVGEAPDRYVYGLLKVYRASIAQGVATDIGGMGLTVEALGGAPGYFTATRRTGAGSIQTGYQNNVSTARYYALHAANNTGLNAKVTFSYFDSELGAVPENLLTAYRSQDNGATWNMYPAIARNSVQNFVRVQNVPGFSQWVLGSYDAPLPVEISSFTGHLQGRVAVLDWATASERNNAGFELLRSADGRNFVKIGWVAAKAEARAGTYSFTDAGFTGKAYYRLRQVDRDGAAKESQTIFLSRDNTELATAQLFPMPAQGKLTLTWPGQEEQTVTARLLSVDGKLIQAATGSLAELSAVLSAQVSALPNGVYQLHLIGAEQTQAMLRVVK